MRSLQPRALELSGLWDGAKRSPLYWQDCSDARVLTVLMKNIMLTIMCNMHGRVANFIRKESKCDLGK